MFGLLQAAAGAAALAGFAWLGPWLPRAQAALAATVESATGSIGLAVAARFVLAAGAVILLPTTLLGAAFPAAVRLTSGSARVGRDVGLVTALNTTGGIAGTFLTGFVALPALGVSRTLGLLATAAVMVGAAAVVRGTNLRPRGIATAIMIAAICFLAAGPADARRLPSPPRAARLPRGGPGRCHGRHRNRSASFRRLYIQGVSTRDSMCRPTCACKLLPLLVHGGEPRSAWWSVSGTAHPGPMRPSTPPSAMRIPARRPRQALSRAIWRPNDPRITLRSRRPELLQAKQY
jgi:spermidine synthase